MSRVIRYFADKIVDQIVGILFLILVTFLVAGVPLVVLPTMSAGFVILTVAFAAFVGIILVVFILPRFRKKVTHDLVKMIQSVNDNGEMWLLGYDHEKWAKELFPVIKSSAKDRHVKFIFLFSYSKSKIFQQAKASDLIENGAVKTGEGSVDNLRKLKQSLAAEDEILQENIEIRFFDLPLVYSMVVINPDAKVGAVVHVWPHMYTMLYPDRLWLTYARDRAEEQAMFEKCKASYKYARSKSWGDGEPVPESVEIWDAELETTPITKPTVVPQAEPELKVETENFKQNLADEFAQILTNELQSDYMTIGFFSHGPVNYFGWRTKSEDTKMKMLGSEFSWFNNLYRAIDQYNGSQQAFNAVNVVKRTREVYDSIPWVKSRHPALEARLQRLEGRSSHWLN